MDNKILKYKVGKQMLDVKSGCQESTLEYQACLICCEESGQYAVYSIIILFTYALDSLGGFLSPLVDTL